MIKKRLSFACLAVLLVFSCQIQAAPLVEWPEPLVDVLVHTRNVCDFGAVAGDGKDDTSAFQKAIDAAVADGGGIVFAPAGRYTFYGRLTMRPGITLRGEWRDPARNDAFEGITVLDVFSGKNEPDGAPFIKMLFAACVRNLTFFYPEQSPDAVIPYSFTVDSVFNAMVRNVTFVNSYQALGHGATTGSGGNLETQHIYGTPLKTGLFINSGYDFNAPSLVKFRPEYWIRFSKLDESEQSGLKDYLHDSADGVVCTYQDGMMMSKIEVDGYRTGIHFRKYNSKAGVPRTASYGQIYELNLTDCRTALQADEILYPGLTLQRSVLHGIDHALFNQAHGPLMLSGVKLTADSGSAVKQTGATSRLALNHCEVESKTTDAVQLEAGAMNIQRTTFTSPAKHLRAAPGSAGVMLLGNRFAGRDADLAVECPVRRIDHAPLKGGPLKPPPLVWPQDRRPVSDRVVNARGFSSLQQAMDSLGSAGGTVFLPAGEYHITVPLTVPPHVELRGVGDGNARPAEPIDGPDRPRVPGSVLLAEMPADQNSPLLTLSAKSGVRGISIVYPDRNSLKSNPAYPPAIYSSSPDCYVMYTALCNPYLGILFKNADRHLVKFCRTGTDHLGIRVDGGRDGQICGFSHHAQYWTLSVPTDWGMPSYVNESPWHYTINCADGMELLGCRNEKVYGFGTWETRNMLCLGAGSDGRSADAQMIIASSDCAGGTAVHLKAGAARLAMYGTHIFRGATSQMQQEQVSVQTDAGFDGQVLLAGNLFRNADIRLKGDGEVSLVSSLFFWSPGQIQVEGGHLLLEDAFSDLSAVTGASNATLTARGVMDKQGVISKKADRDSVGMLVWPDAPWSKALDDQR